MKTNQLRKTIILAIPVIFDQLGQMLMGFTDSIMVGKLGSLELAASSFVINVFSIALVCFIGLTAGIAVNVSQSFGAGKKQDCGHYFFNGLFVSLVAVLVMMLILFSLTPFLRIFGQVPAITEAAGPFYVVIVWSMLPLFLFFGYKQFLNGLQRTTPSMVATFLGIGLNFFFNYLLIFGHWGFPKMGLFGSGVSTLISRVLMTLGLVAYVHSAKFYRDYMFKFSLRLNRAKILSILRIGLPSACQLLFEVGAFSGAGILVGWISVEALAAHQIVLTLASTTFMVALGISIASSVRVGEAYGAKSYSEVRSIAFGALLFTFFYEVCSSAVFISARFVLPKIFTFDRHLIEGAASLLIIGGVFQIFDGVQVVAAGLLRGVSDVKIPTYITFFAYWVVGMPLVYLLAFKEGLGVQGVWWGLALSLFAAALLLISRFVIHTRTFRSLKCFEG